MWCFSLILYYSLQQRSNPKDLDRRLLPSATCPGFHAGCNLPQPTKCRGELGPVTKDFALLGGKGGFWTMLWSICWKVRWWQGLHPQSLHLLSRDVQQVILLQLWLCSPSKLSRMTLYSIIKQESRIVFHRFVGKCYRLTGETTSDEVHLAVDKNIDMKLRIGKRKCLWTLNTRYL